MQGISWCNRQTLQGSTWNDVQRRVSNPVRAAIDKVLTSLDGAVLSREECLRLAHAEGDDLFGLVVAANDLRQRLVGDVVSYVVTRNINFTNVCFVGCKFCAFSVGPRDETAYFLSLDEMAHKCREAEEWGATEVCIQGGLPRTLSDAPEGRGGTWNRDGVIVFGPGFGPLYRVSAAGGKATPLTKLDTARQETLRYGQQRYRDFLIAALVDIVLMLGLSLWIITHFITKPLRALAAAIIRTSKGDYTAPLPNNVGSGEVASVWKALDVLKTRAIEAEKAAAAQREAERQQERELRQILLD